MAGYNGYKMSNNAVAAYENGEKPLTKWSRSEILESVEDAINTGELVLGFSKEKLKKMPVNMLKELCLSCTSWHHTSKRFNRTNFYSLDFYRLPYLTDEEIDEMIAESKAATKKKSKEERWKCAFLEWGGTQRHPTAKEIIEEGTVKGNWFYRSNGNKKKTTANGFRFIEKIE